MLRSRGYSLDEKVEMRKRQIRRELLLSHELHDGWPGALDAEHTIDGIGDTCIRAFVFIPRLKPGCYEAYSDSARRELTQKIRRHLVKKFGSAERGFRPDCGEFFWKIERRGCRDEDGKYDVIVFLDEAHPEECTVRRVTKRVTEFESSCPRTDENGRSDAD